jgi:hypothetical protein
MLDVVVVPDFDGPRRSTFEAQALLFLASWIENAGAARRFPLHFACIGEPPNSVARLADRANAELSVHEALPGDDRRVNKFRAADVKPRTERLAFFDVDMVVLGDLSRLAEIPPDTISAAPELHPKVAPSTWRRLYQALDVPLPVERIPSRLSELRLPLKYEHFEGEEACLPAMIPWWNSGLFVTPWRFDLVGTWRRQMENVRSLEGPDTPGWRHVQANDQPLFAVMVHSLLASGARFQRLPRGFNVLWQELHAGDIGLGGAAAFHATTAFRHLEPGSLTRESFEGGLEAYGERMSRRSRRLLRCGLGTASAPRSVVQAIGAAPRRRRLVSRLRQLYRDHIRELL